MALRNWFQKNYLKALGWGALATAVVAVFWPTFRAGFINLDDPFVLLHNLAVKNFDLRRIFFERNVKDYIPFIYLSFALEHAAAGLNPLIYHVDNFVLHLLNSVLVFFLALRLSQKRLAAWLTAIVFAIHPMHMESVAWVTERKDVLSTFFVLISFLLYLQYSDSDEKAFSRSSRHSRYGLSLFCFALAVSSKAMTVTLPLLFFLSDILKRRPHWKALLVEKIPFFTVAVGFTFLAKQLQGTKNSLPWSLSYLKDGVDSLAFYVQKLFVPTGLATFYEKGVVIVGKAAYLTLALVVIALLYLWRAGKLSGRELFFGAGFFLIGIAPVLQIIPFGNNFAFADRYVYLPSLGLFFVVGLAVESVFFEAESKRYLKALGAFLCTALFLVFGVVAHGRAEVWQNSETYWNDAISKYPQSSFAYFGLGAYYEEIGNLDKAQSTYETGVSMNPLQVYARLNLGEVYFRRGLTDKAEGEFRRAIKDDPGYAEAYNNLGYILYQKGQYKEAEQNLLAAVQLDPSYPDPHMTLSLIYEKVGLTGPATMENQKYQELTSKGPMALSGRGRLYGQGQVPQ